MARPFGASFSLTGLSGQFRTGIPTAQLSRLSSGTVINAAVTVSMAVLISAFVLLDSRQPWVIAWMLAQLTLSLLVYQRARRPLTMSGNAIAHSRLSRSGLRHAIAWAALSGGLWGALTLFLPVSSPEARLAIILTIGGMAAGGSTTLAPVPQVAIMFIFACGTPLVLYFISLGTALGMMVAASTVVFGAAMVGTTRVVYLTLERQFDAEERSEYYRAAHLQQRIAVVANEVRPFEDILHDCIEELCVYAGWPAGRAYLASTGSKNEFVRTGVSYATDEQRFGPVEGFDGSSSHANHRSLLLTASITARPAWENLRHQAERTSTPKIDRTNATRMRSSMSGLDVPAQFAIAVPILVGTRVAAVLEFFSDDAGRPSESQVELLAAIGIQMGRAIERHKAVRRLRESEGKTRREEIRAREYLDIAGSVILAIDRSERLTLLNQSGAKLLECSEENAIGRNWFDHFAPSEARESQRAQFGRWMRGQDPLTADGETRVISSGGKEHLVRAQMALLRDEDGDIAGLLASGQDITQQRRVETQLLHTQKMDAVGQLASGIAHDFNNILTAAGGNLELLEAQALSEAARQLVANSKSALDIAAALTSQLLSVSRKSLLSPKPIDVGERVNSMMEMVGRTLGPDIEVHVSSTAELWPAIADLSQLETSVLNLAINGRDAMPEGGRLEIIQSNVCLDQGEAEDLGIAPGEYVSIAVSDTGIGMSMAVQSRIFEPFFTTKNAQSGTGLGLSMVYGFAKQSGGAVKVASEPGAGTTITLLLPRSAKDPKIDTTFNQPASSAEEPKGRILVVDDDAQIRALICTMLTTERLDFLEAPNAERALELLESGHTAQLLLTDIQLGPGLDGYQLARRVLESWPSMRVLFMSGFASEGPEGQGWPESALIHKPFNLRQLASAVTEALLSPGTAKSSRTDTDGRRSVTPIV